MKRFAAAVLILVATTLAQVPVEVVSMARSHDRDEWAHVAVPAEIVDPGAIWGVLEPYGWPCYVGRKLGDHSVIVHIWCRGLHPMERVSGQVAWTDEQPEIPELDWASSDDLAPHGAVYIQESGRVVQMHEDPGSVRGEVVHEDHVERITRYQERFIFRGVEQPLWWRAYLYQYRGSPMALWDFQVLLSDSSSPAVAYDTFRTRLRTSAPHVVDNTNAFGAWSIPADVNGFNLSNLLTETRYVDGVRPFWTGRSVAVPDCIPIEALTDPEHPIRAQVQAAQAALEGPVLATCAAGTWDGRWLALGGVGDLPRGTEPWPAGEAVWREWQAFSRQRRSYWTSRPHGMAKYPGQTGAQPNHGVVRGSEIVTTGCPLPLDGWSYRITSQMRPVGYYHHDLSRVSRQTNPQWATWSGRTFVRDAFTDTLGKRIRPLEHFRPTLEGWDGQDQQHYGHLELMTWYALTGRLVARDLIDDLVEVWIAAYDEFEARSIGRVWLDMATAYRLRLDDRILPRIASQAELMHGWTDGISGPVKAWPRFTDPRALVDAAGNPVTCGVAWQIGLMAPGLVAADNVMGDPFIRATLEHNVNALVDAAWFKVGDQWMCADYWAFRDGKMPDASYFGTDGNVPGLSHTTGWFYDWNRFATQTAAKLGNARAQEIVDAFYGYPGDDWIASQWHTR